MSRAGVVIGAVALLGLGGYAALPDDGPEYLGDMPSILERADDAGSAPPPFVPPPSVPDPPHVAGPEAVALEAPPAIPSVPGERVPAPVTDAPSDITPGTGGTGSDAPSGGLLDFLDGLPLDGALVCVDVDTIVRPGVGTIDCLTGEILEPDPPVDPCDVEIPLPVGCPAVLPGD